jgi:dTDP-glucose 4,6-dehydratase
MHALILGGSGFFGKSILDAYKKGLLNSLSINKISILSRRATDLKITHPQLLDSSIHLIDADLMTCDALPYADIVIHAAASADAVRYELYPEQERENIILSVQNFCELARIYCRKSKILFVSSGAVYGNYIHEIENIGEDYLFGNDEEIDLSKYIYTKAKRECEVRFQELGSSGFKVSIARCFAFVGKYLPRDRHFAIGNFIRDGLNEEPVVVNATSQVYRSYMHADDLVLWLMKIASASNENTPIFNVGSDESISIQELGYKIAKYFNVEYVVAPITNSHIHRYVPSIERAKSELGLTLHMNLDQAIHETIKSIRVV